MLYEILPDPRALVAAKGDGAARVLHIHRPIPDSVPVGHFTDSGTEVVDEVVSRPDYLDRIAQACAALKGFSSLPAVKSLFAYDSRLDLPWSRLPRTLTHFRLMTKSVKGRDAHAAEVRARGLNPAVHPDAEFFYK